MNEQRMTLENLMKYPGTEIVVLVGCECEKLDIESGYL